MQAEQAKSQNSKTLTGIRGDISSQQLLYNDLLPAYDIQYNLGTSLLRWKAVYGFNIFAANQLTCGGSTFLQNLSVAQNATFDGNVQFDGNTTFAGTNNRFETITSKALYVVPDYSVAVPKPGYVNDIYGDTVFEDDVRILGDLFVEGATGISFPNVITLTPLTGSSEGFNLYTPNINIMGLTQVDKFMSFRTDNATGYDDPSAAIYFQGGMSLVKDAWIGGSVYVGGNISTVGSFTISSDAESTSTTTGAFVTAGGLGLGKNLNVGGNVDIIGNINIQNTGDWFSSELDPASIRTAGGMDIAKSLNIENNLNVDQTVTVGQTIQAQQSISTLQNIAAFGTTNSTSSSTGAIVTAGGLGVGLNANIGGNLRIGGLSASTSSTTGAVTIAGGLGVVGTTHIGNILIINSDNTGSAPLLRITPSTTSGPSTIAFYQTLDRTGALWSIGHNTGGLGLIDTFGIFSSTLGLNAAYINNSGNLFVHKSIKAGDPGDNAFIGIDTANSGNTRLGMVKKSGSNPLFATASGVPMTFAVSSTASIEPSTSTFTNIAQINSSGLNVLVNTQSTSSTSGAIITAGGVGIARDLWCAGIGRFTTSLRGGQGLTTSTENSSFITNSTHILYSPPIAQSSLGSTLTLVNNAYDGTGNQPGGSISFAGPYTNFGPNLTGVFGRIIGRGASATFGGGLVMQSVGGDGLLKDTFSIDSNQNATVTGNFTVTGILSSTSTTSSTSSITGAIVTAGGLGVGLNANIGGNLTINRNNTSDTPMIRITPTTSNGESSIGFYQTTNLLGSFWVLGHNTGSVGVGNLGFFNTGIGANVAHLTTNGLNIQRTTASTSTTTGALIVAGGGGFGGNLNAGGSIRSENASVARIFTQNVSSWSGVIAISASGSSTVVAHGDMFFQAMGSGVFINPLSASGYYGQLTNSGAVGVPNQDYQGVCNVHILGANSIQVYFDNDSGVSAISYVGSIGSGAGKSISFFTTSGGFQLVMTPGTYCKIITQVRFNVALGTAVKTQLVYGYITN